VHAVADKNSRTVCLLCCGSLPPPLFDLTVARVLSCNDVNHISNISLPKNHSTTRQQYEAEMHCDRCMHVMREKIGELRISFTIASSRALPSDRVD
jgi:hypothetical protein